MTLTDAESRRCRLRWGGAVAALFCAMLAGCSVAAPLPAGNETADVSTAAVAGGPTNERAPAPAPARIDDAALDVAGEKLRPTGAPGPAPLGSKRYKVSKVLGKRDRTLQGNDRVCDITFVYAGREPENVFWEEPCRAVTATMMNRTQLERLNRWERLDEFQQKFVQQMPGGLVLYIGGGFSAAVYPYGTTGTSEEVVVAD